MNKYETVVIFDPRKTTKDSVQDFYDIFRKVTDKIYVEDLGEKQLAYAIKGLETGHYFIVKYYAENTEGLSIICRRKDYIMKFITRKMNDDGKITGEIIIDFNAPLNRDEIKIKPSSFTIDALDVMLGLAKY